MGWYFLQWWAGAIVWALANVVYADMKRKGIRGFGRFAAFWVGLPGTLFSLIFIREGRVERFDPPPDDDERLLTEIRIDRELRRRGRPLATEPKLTEEEVRGGEGTSPR